MCCVPWGMQVLISLIGNVFEVQRAGGCVWFGEPGRCAAFNVVLAVLGTCALGDFFISIIMVWEFCCAANESDAITLP
jgi:hypothetical protein